MSSRISRETGLGPSSSSTAFSLQPPDLSCCTKEQVRDYFLNSYDLYETLFSCIKDESTFYKQPDKLRLQLIFYLGHTSAVYINKLQLSGALKDRTELCMDAQFETGVDEMVWDTTDHCRLGGEFHWPSIPEVWQYRADVKQTILKLIDEEPLELPLLHRDPWWALMLGIEHERIHCETSSVLLRQLPVGLVKTPRNWQYAPATTSAGQSVLENRFIDVEETSVQLGKPDDFPSFGWDNEYGSLTAKVPAFSARQYLTTNREFLEFVQAGGYDNKAYWTEEGWKWRCKRKSQHPTFWICTQGCQSGCEGDISDHSHCTEDAGGCSDVFRYRAMFDVIDMPLDWPAETNYHESSAFCRWLGRGHRVLTEAEFVVIRGVDKDVSPSSVKADVIFREEVTERFNLNMSFASSTPVDFYPSNAAGFHDTMGNVWQWMEDHFNGFPGAEFDYLYHDFSTPYYDGYHNTILGGSWISTGDSASSYARFWFRRHFFQHMGFRVVRSANAPPAQLLSTPVYQPQKGFIHMEHPLPEFPLQPRIESFTADFQLEKDSNIESELRWDYGSSVKVKNIDDLIVLNAISGFQNDSSEPQLSLDLGRNKSPLQHLQSAGSYWSSISRMLGIAVKQIDRCEDRALVIGSGTGRLAFEVSNFYETVLGIHPVARSIDIAETLQQGKVPTGAAVENISLSDLTFPQKTYPNITFKQFLWVPLEMGKFDLVVLALLDISSCPEYWIARLPLILSESGVAMIVSAGWTASRLQPAMAKGGLKQLDSHKFTRSQVADARNSTSSKAAVHVSLWYHT